MVSEQAIDFFETSNNPFWKGTILLSALLFVVLLLISIFYPLFKKMPLPASIQVHKNDVVFKATPLPGYQKVAIALDFSDRDQKVLTHAITQASRGSTVVLIHVVESAPASILGRETDDFETRKDQEKLDSYAAQLEQYGLKAETFLGFRDRSKEIARIVIESGADLLIIGAHGHTGMKDWFYGETISAVRHRLKIPVLIV
jgi:manganese transport protein